MNSGDLFDDVPRETHESAEKKEPIETERHKLHKKNGPETSRDAAYGVDVKGRQQLVLDEIRRSGLSGITCKEILARHPNVPYPSISGRPRDLLEQNLIFYRGDRRDGARIMRAKQHDTGYRLCGSCGTVLLKFYDMVCQSEKCIKKREKSNEV